MKAKFRKTGEIVDIISYSGNTDRNDVLDSVSYIDSKGVEHSREKLNLYWDFESLPVVLHHNKMGGGYDVLNPQTESLKLYLREGVKISTTYTHYLPIPKLEV